MADYSPPDQSYGYELSGPTLDISKVNASMVKDGKMYMVTLGSNFRFPIHPEPNADHKIAKLVRQYEVIITLKDSDPKYPNYIQTVLPISGYVKKECVDDGTLVEVTPKTYDQFKTNDKKNILSGCLNCLRNTSCCRSFSTQVRKHPVYVMAGYLLLQFLAEVVIFADLITDITVAYALASAGLNWLFMLTCVFMLAPYYIAWAAAFGYLQKRAMESTAAAAIERAADDATQTNDDNPDAHKSDSDIVDDKKKDPKKKSSSSSPDKKIQIGVILFAIAPIGVLWLIIMDIYLLFEDFLIKPIWLCCSKQILREESHAERGYKKLRRVSEVVAETICQTVLQLYIVMALGSDLEGIHFVYISLCTSISVLILWGIVLSIEAKGFGLHFYEYVTVVLQGSFNFVPYLPAIERGKKDRVNWTDFRFDSHSVGLVSKALISPECNLKEIKLSGYSLRKLTRHECKFLGQMLADSPKDSVKVVFSRSRKEIEELFNKFDTDKSRTFDFKEFVQLCAALRQNDDGVVSAKDVSDIFSVLADEEKHEVYLTDLLWKINKSVHRLPVVDYDSPVMYALKERNQKLLTFMIAAKVCDDVTWEYYTTTLVTTNRHDDALMMCEERGIPMVVELISGHDLPAKKTDDDDDKTPDPYCSVSVAGKVKRTEKKEKSLNPVWRQPLLFVIPPEDIPAKLSGGAGIDRGITMVNQSTGALNRRRRTSYSGHNNYHKRSTIGGQHHTHHAHHGQRGVVGGTTSRLEINMKVYDYDETDDDFFMGSHKHLIKWTLDDLAKHQPANQQPKIIQKDLTNRYQKTGSFKFRIYTGTLQHYIKWIRNKRLRTNSTTIAVEK